MKEYFFLNLKREKGSRIFVELIDSNEETETFLIVNKNKEISLKINEFIKEEIPIEKIHLQRLKFLDAKGKIVINKGISVESYYFHIDIEKLNSHKDILIIYREKHFPGFIVVNKPNIEILRKKLIDLAEKFKNQKLSIKEVSKELNGVYSLNQLFKILKENYDFQFNELEIIKES